ncbi:lymphocyte antigen 6 complex locus L [Cricetulus griseus]
MTQLLLALWASMVSVELARGLATREPGKGWTGLERDGMGWVRPALPTHRHIFLTTDQNLSCFQCFKVQQPNQCRPIKCQPDEKFCQSNEVLVYSSESFLGPGRLQGQWPHTHRPSASSRCWTIRKSVV